MVAIFALDLFFSWLSFFKAAVSLFDLPVAFFSGLEVADVELAALALLAGAFDVLLADVLSLLYVLLADLLPLFIAE